MKKGLTALIVVAALGGSGYAYYKYRKTAPAPTVTTAAVTRGDIADTVGATGTLQAVTTVQVGTQVSGTIQDLYADFNSLVRKGQVIARLDPSLFQTQIEQARANLIRAQADVERLKVALDDARTKLTRARELHERQLIPQTELDTAEVNLRSAEAQLRSSQAQVTQAEASLNQNQVNLQHTIITAPIDGLVISRNVDRGQTVAASMQAPTLFVLAADLTKMQVVANLDESDVGRIRPGQRVRFRVDAYPAEDFSGTVQQVRLQPIVQQNVVTYATVIDVPNPDLKLKPGMTANVNVEIARRTDVLRIPNAALRFRPTNEMFAALGQTPPQGGPANAAWGGRGQRAFQGGEGSAPGGSSQGARGPTQGTGGSSQSAEGSSQGAGGFSQSAEGYSQGGGGRRNFDPSRTAERMQNMSPEERKRFTARRRARGGDASAEVDRGATTGRDGTDGRPGRQGRGAEPKPTPLAARNPRATTVDALFAPLPPVESRGQAWVYIDKQLKPVRLRLGITDGQATELLEGDVKQGDELVTNVTTGNETTRPTTGFGGFPPFMGPGGRDGRFGGPGGFGGGGRGGAGGRGR